LNLIESGYEILVILAVSDLQLHKKELLRIEKYLVKNDYIFNTDLPSTSEIISLSNEEKLKRLLELALVFKKSSNLDKNKMIMLGLQLILSDRRLTDHEMTRFEILGEFWDIDVHKMIHDKLNS
jgi:hypothetical protein